MKTRKFRILAAIVGLIAVMGLGFSACAGPDTQSELPPGLESVTIYKSKT